MAVRSICCKRYHLQVLSTVRACRANRMDCRLLDNGLAEQPILQCLDQRAVAAHPKPKRKVHYPPPID